jgi:hypothetical protein
MTRRERAETEMLISTLVRRLRDMVDHEGRLEKGEAESIRIQIARLREKLSMGGRG